MMARHRNRILSMGVVAALLAFGCAEAPAGGAGDYDSLEELAASVLSQIDGEIVLDGLSEPVEVIRDEWGVPHIYAENTEDLFFAQGYVMAQDRLWQMELWRRWREGRLAEIYGPAALEYDERTRLMMFRGPFDDSEWTSYHPEAERIFTAYANGVNAFIERNADRLPVEFRLTGIEPDPWTAETVVLRWAQIGLSSVRGHPISEIQLAMEVARLGPEEANRRAAPDPWDDLVVPEGLNLDLFTDELLEAARAGDADPFVAGRLPDLEILEPYTALVSDTQVSHLSVPWGPSDAGSNNWVVSGARTASGVPIMANDPHRRIEMPALRYFIHLHAPEWHLFGGGEPPFVGVDAGSNETMAWGFTFAGTDMVDLFVEELHPEDDGLVRWQDGWEPIEVITEEIWVKGEEQPRTVELKFSRNGPIFYEDLENRSAFAVRSVNQEPGTAPYFGSFALAQASSCGDFFERAMSWRVPTHSLVCGDAEGNIALQVSGLTPDRDGWNGRLPVPGDGRFAWVGFREDLPREMNPDRGYVASANNNVHPDGYEGRPVFYHSSSGVETSRIARLRQILDEAENTTVEDHERFHHDEYSLRAERELPLFQGWTSDDPEVERAREMVAEWDAVLSAGTTAGAIYVRWTGAVPSAALDPDTPPMERQELVETGLRGAIDTLTSELGDDWSEWRYGRIHSSEFTHMLGSAFDLPPIERGGGFGTLNATGANFRRIIDLADIDNSVWTNAPGQSGQLGSPFYANTRENLASGEYQPVLFSREAVESRAAHTLSLLPGG